MTSTTFNTPVQVRTHATGLQSIVERVHAVLTRQATRRALADLDARLLADVGLTREQALYESAKPVWSA